MIKLKVNIAMNGVKAGETIQLDTDEEGNILDDFWARRLDDSRLDNCVEKVTPQKTKGDK